MDKIKIIGAGLAGCEAAWQIAERGIEAELYEMRPALMTPAHKTGNLAEIVCSNSLGSDFSRRNFERRIKNFWFADSFLCRRIKSPCRRGIGS